MKAHKIYILFSLLAVLVSCNKGNEEVVVDLGYGYYPLAIGNEWVYEVTVIDKNTISEDTSVYQLKERVVELVDGGDEDNFLLYRSKRQHEGETWVVDSVWSVKKEKNYLVKTENNVRFQKMAFGVVEGKTWDGNIWNIFDQEIYTVVGVGKSATIGGVLYAEVLEIEQKVEKNLILSVDNRERYAKGVGLISIYKEDLETQPGEKTLGVIYQQVLLSYQLGD